MRVLRPIEHVMSNRSNEVRAQALKAAVLVAGPLCEQEESEARPVQDPAHIADGAIEDGIDRRLWSRCARSVAEIEEAVLREQAG